MTPQIQSLLDVITGTVELEGNEVRWVFDEGVGRAMEASLDVLEALADHLKSAGAVTIETAVAIGDGIKVHSPTTGSKWRKGVAVDLPSGGIVAMLELANEPDPAIDRLLSREFGIAPSGPMEPGEATAINLYKWNTADPSGGQSLKDAIVASVEDSYHRGELGSASRATLYEYAGEDPRWSGGSHEVRNLDFPFRWFPALATVAAHFGMDAQYQAGAAFVASRPTRTLGLEDSDRCAELGRLAAEADGYVIGDVFRATIEHLYARAASNALSARQRYLQRAGKLLVTNGHTSAKEAFDYNDLDSNAWATTDPDDARHIVCLSDQNGKYRLLNQFDEDNNLMALEIHRGWTGDLAKPFAAFERRDGHLVTTLGPFLQADIRSFNAVIAEIEGADICLGEDYPEVGAKRP